MNLPLHLANALLSGVQIYHPFLFLNKLFIAFFIIILITLF